MVVVVSSVALAPGQSARALGVEIGGIGLFALWRILRLEALYLPLTGELYRHRALRLTWMCRLAVGAVSTAGLLLLTTGDLRSLDVLTVGILLSFAAAGMSAWILLIEINR